jgi:excinuclease UvrABC helicase subunit UvrB
MFALQSEYAPSGDQPQAIKDILATFAKKKKSVTLL